MDLHTLAQRARDALPRLSRWALRRAGERSTWIGLATAAGALGFSHLAPHLEQLGDAVPALLVAAGVGMASASTTPHHPDQPQG